MTVIKFQNKGYKVPENIYPDSVACIVVPVPNEPTYLDNFYGAIWTLTRWFNYRQNPEKSGKQVADVWRDIYEELQQGVCEMPIEFREETCGVLEYSLDGGDTWAEVADFNPCFVAINPTTTNRNVVQPTGNFKAIAFKPFPGSTLPTVEFYGQNDVLFATFAANGRFSLRASMAAQTLIDSEHGAIYSGAAGFGQANSGTLILQPRNTNGVAVATATSGSTPTIKHLVNNSGQLGVFPGVTATTISARMHVKAVLATDIVGIDQATAAQTANIREFRNSANLFLSGIDNVGRFISATFAGKPSNLIVRPGTISIDAADEKIWVKGANSGVDDWWSIESGQQITSAEATTLDPGEPATAEIVDGVLEIGVPKGDSGTNGANGIKFLAFRQRPLPGENEVIDIPVLADGYAYLPYQVQNGDVIEIMQNEGWWSDYYWTPGATAPDIGFEADGSVYGQPPQTYSYDSLDPVAAAPHMSCILSYKQNTGVAGAAVNPQFIEFISDLDTNHPYVWFYPNCANLDGNSGGVVLRVNFSAAQLPTIDCASTDFELAESGFYLKPSSELPALAITGFDPEDVKGGLYVLGEGFVTTSEVVSDFPSQISKVVVIKGVFSPALTGWHRYTITFELSGLTGADINIRGQIATKSTGQNWSIGNLSHNVFYGNGTHTLFYDRENGEAVAFMLHTIPAETQEAWSITIKAFDCEAL